MRSITALEYEFLPIAEAIGDLAALVQVEQPSAITDAEASQLLRMNRERPGFCERLAGGVRLSQYCGVVRLQDRILEILPKISSSSGRIANEAAAARRALLKMLSEASGVSVRATDAVTQGNVNAPLLDIFIEEFLQCALAQARRGLIARYVPQQDDLSVIKGRFDVRTHIRRNISRPHLLYCEFDEFTADNPYNKAVQAALQLCRPWIGRSSTQRLWWETHSRFAAISHVRTSAKAVARLPRDRSTARYEALLKWCEWLLALASPSLSAGEHEAPGLLFDMNKLFESHVANVVRAEESVHRSVIRHAPVEALATVGSNPVFQLRPDITIWSKLGIDGSQVLEKIVDAKWKILSPSRTDWDVAESDVYQMLAYAVRYGCQRLELIYPQPVNWHAPSPATPVFKLMGASGNAGHAIHVAVRLIPLWSSRQALANAA